MKAIRPLPRLALVGFLLLPVGLILLPMEVGGVVPPQSLPGKMAAQTGATFARATSSVRRLWPEGV